MSNWNRLIHTGSLHLLSVLLCLVSSLLYADTSVIYYHNNALGSPVATTDESGTVIWREDYAPYGKKLSNELEANIEKVGYTGHRYDSETGLVYAGARMYDPELGRFMGVDPVNAQAALDNPVMFNRYAYGNNNPYKYVDPDGEFAVPIIIIAAFFIGDIALSVGHKNAPGDDSIRQVAPDLGLGLLGKSLKGVKLFGKVDDVPKGGSTTLYRAVSKAELDDIAANGVRTTAGGYETGKLFATSLDDAAKFGKNNFKLDGIPNHLIKVDVPNSVMKNAHKFRADSMDAISIPANQLNKLNSTPLNFSPLVK